MRRSIAFGCALLATTVIGVASGGDLESGLQVGEAAGPFQVRNVTGMNCKGLSQNDQGSLCYR